MKARILVVEDDLVIQLDLRSSLKQLGYEAQPGRIERIAKPLEVLHLRGPREEIGRSADRGREKRRSLYSGR